MADKYQKLLFLPRVMIENYAVDPDELVGLLPSNQIMGIGEFNMRQTINSELEDWLLHGALSQVLYENKAGDFCARNIGFPNRLLNPPHAPVTDTSEIESWLRKWHEQLDPAQIMPAYQQRVSEVRGKTASEQYQQCIDGKLFFQEVIVNKILNTTPNKRKSGDWLEEIFKATHLSQCPLDLVPILKRLMERENLNL